MYYKINASTGRKQGTQCLKPAIIRIQCKDKKAQLLPT